MKTKRNVSVDDMLRVYRETGSFKKSGKLLHVNSDRIRKILTNEGFVKSYEDRDKEIAGFYDGVVSAKEVSELTGVTSRVVLNVWKKFGLDANTANSLSNRHSDKSIDALKYGRQTNKTKDPSKYISKYTSRFEYVSGFTGSSGHAVVRCKTCGREIEISCVSLRQLGDRYRCNECKEDERKEREERLIAEKESAEMLKEAKKEARIKAREEERSSKKRIVTCRECGEAFETYSQIPVYCSDECRKRALNRHKDRRISSLIVKDKGITLRKLYKRDNGTCYLCGEKCDWNDKKVVDGCTICGSMYPSIEHVIPLSKGGTHSWDNVRLACRGCNTKKGSKIILPAKLSEQLKLSI